MKNEFTEKEKLEHTEKIQKLHNEILDVLGDEQIFIGLNALEFTIMVLLNNSTSDDEKVLEYLAQSCKTMIETAPKIRGIPTKMVDNRFNVNIK